MLNITITSDLILNTLVNTGVILFSVVSEEHSEERLERSGVACL